MKWYGYVIIGLVVAGCGPASKLRRAERLIAKAELQGAKWHIDTVFKIVPVTTKLVERDTVVLNAPGDTIVITKDKLRVKLKVMRDSIYVNGECLPDTIKVIVPVQVTKTIEAPKGITWWEAVLGIILAFVIGYVVRLLTGRKS